MAVVVGSVVWDSHEEEEPLSVVMARARKAQELYEQRYNVQLSFDTADALDTED